MGNLWADCPTPLECRGSIPIPTAPTKMINRFDWRRNILFGASRNWANNLQRRKVPTTSWLCAKRSVVQMSSSNDLHFPLQIGVKWRDAATTFSSFCSPRSPNRTGFGMGRLKPRPTFSPHSSRYWTSSRRTPVARAHVVVLMGHPVSRNANVRFGRSAHFRNTTPTPKDS